nr:hypothetical protein [Tanacetum cinerariifolium]
MNTLVEYMIPFGADNHPPMLDKDLYDSWKSQIEYYMQNREHRRMILESVENGPLIWPTVKENEVTRTKKYDELSAAEKIQVDCDKKATNIILQGSKYNKFKGDKPKKPKNAAWYKEKAMLVEAQEDGKFLDEERLTFLADPGVPDVTAELEIYKERVKTFEHRLNIDLSSREKMIDSQMDDMIKEKLALKEQVDTLEHKLFNEIKEKECLLQTFTTFKCESKEKEDKNIENEIDLEKKLFL